MTKKRLTDMLREEMQKTSEVVDANITETSPTIEVTAELVKDAPAQEESTEESLEVIPELASDRPVDVSPKTRHSSNPTKAELEALVTELKNSLLTSQQTETKLLQQIDKLQAEVQEQKQRVSNLKEYLEQANQLKAELDRVKQDNAGLTESNQLLNAELSKLQSAQSKLALPKNSAKPEVKPAGAFKRPTSVAIRPIGSNNRLSGISNDNIGWVD